MRKVPVGFLMRWVTIFSCYPPLSSFIFNPDSSCGLIVPSADGAEAPLD